MLGYQQLVSIAYIIHTIYSLNIVNKYITVPGNTSTIFPIFSLGKTHTSLKIQHSPYWEGSGVFFTYLAFGDDCISPPATYSSYLAKAQYRTDAFSTLEIKAEETFVPFGKAPFCVILYCHNLYMSCSLIVDLHVTAGASVKESDLAVPLGSLSFIVDGTGFSRRDTRQGVYCRVGASFFTCSVMFILSSTKMRIQSKDPIALEGPIYFAIRDSGFAPVKVGNCQKEYVSKEAVKKGIGAGIFILVSLGLVGHIRKRRITQKYKKVLKRYKGDFSK